MRGNTEALKNATAAVNVNTQLKRQLKAGYADT